MQNIRCFVFLNCRDSGNRKKPHGAMDFIKIKKKTVENHLIFDFFFSIFIQHNFADKIFKHSV